MKRQGCKPTCRAEKCCGAGRDGWRLAGYALLALLSAFALVARYTQDGTGSFLDLAYASMGGNGLVAPVLAVLLFFAYRRMYGCARGARAQKRRACVCADIFAVLFSLAAVAGRAFLVREPIGETYDYGSFSPVFCSAGHIFFSLLMFAGMFALSRMAALAAFDVLDGTALRCLRDVVKERAERGVAPLMRVVRFLATPWHVALVLLVCWLPYVVIYFPGSIYHDGAYQVRQFFGIQDMTGHHPIATTFIFGWLLSIGKAFGNDALGVFLITCLQGAALAYACTRVVGRVSGFGGCGRGSGVTCALPEEAAGLRRFAAPALTAFFALVPLFGYAVISIKKDTLFYVAFTLLALAALDLASRLVADARGDVPESVRGDRRKGIAGLLPAGVWGSSGAACARMVLWGCLTSMFRNDGFAFFVALTVCVAAASLLEARAERKRTRTVAASPETGTLADIPAPPTVSPSTDPAPAPPCAPASRIPLLAAPLMCLIAVGSIYIVGYMLFAMTALGVERGSIAEALSLPLQQTARYCIFAPDDVDDEFAEAVGGVLLADGLNVEAYNPRCSDSLKFYHFNEKCTTDELLAFLGAWLSGGLRHPEIYAEAFVDQTSGWWYIEQLFAPDETASGMLLYQSAPRTQMYCDALSFKMPLYDTPLREGFERLTYAVPYVPVLGLFTYPPVYFWLLALVFVWGIARKNPRVLMLVPLFVYFGVCLASPVNGLTRYAIPLMMALAPVAAFVLEHRARPADAPARADAAPACG